MRIEALRQPRRRPLSLTSLIDVIFLLLLFFMLSSTFTRFAKVEIAGGAAAAGGGPAPDVLIRIDDNRRWRINGQTLDADGAAAELRRLDAAGAESAVLLVRGALTSQALVDAMERIRKDTRLSLSIAR